MEYLNLYLYYEFERLRDLVVRFKGVLRLIKLSILRQNDSVYNENVNDTRSGKTLINLITYQWVRSFMSRYSIIIRKQSGALIWSTEKILYTEKCIEFNLGQLCYDFKAGVLNENTTENLMWLNLSSKWTTVSPLVSNGTPILTKLTWILLVFVWSRRYESHVVLYQIMSPLWSFLVTKGELIQYVMFMTNTSAFHTFQIEQDG